MGSAVPNIVIELDRKDAEFYGPLVDEMGGNVTTIETSRFDGVLVLQILASITTITLPLVAKLISESIRAHRYVVVKRKGVEIKGLSADDAIKVLRELEDD